MIRGIGGVAVVVSALVHLYLWFDGVKDQGTVGTLFVVNVVAGLVIAVMLRVAALDPAAPAGRVRCDHVRCLPDRGERDAVRHPYGLELVRLGGGGL